MTPSISFATEEPLRRRLFPNHEWALLALLAFEFVIFAIIGDNFLTSANGFEVIRLSVEIGLLALALTPVIITGGIDLSVGSMMGLSAIVCGWLWRDAGLPIWESAALTLLACKTKILTPDQKRACCSRHSELRDRCGITGT